MRNMNLKVVLSLLLVAVTVSSAQRKCCFPDQFVALDGQIVGTVESCKGTAILEAIQLAFDYTNRRVGMFAYIQEEAQVYTYHIIEDYKSGAEYIIQNKTKTCQKVPLPGKNMTHCIPDEALFSSTYTLGDSEVTVDSFSYDVKQAPLAGNMIISVTKNKCIPVGVVFMGTQGGTPVLSMAGYTNFTHGIDDPSLYFTVPPYCPQTFSQEPKMYDSILTKLIA